MRRSQASVDLKWVALLSILVLVFAGLWVQSQQASASAGRKVQGLDYMRRFGKALSLYSEQHEIAIVTNFAGIPTAHFTSEGVDLRYPLDKTKTGWGNVLREGMKINESGSQRYPDVRPREESMIDLESIVGLPTSRFHGHTRPNAQLRNAIKWGETVAIVPDDCRWNYQVGDRFATFCMGGFVRLAPDLSVKRAVAQGKIVDRGVIVNLRHPHFEGNREQWLRDGAPIDKP